MKCPKCGYISFDFSLECPACHKDISGEQAKLNLPSFKPETPSLLGALTGEASDSGTSPIVTPKSEAGEEVSAPDLDLPDESEQIEFEEPAPSESQEIAFGEEESQELTLEPEEETITDLDLEGPADVDLGIGASGPSEISFDEPEPAKGPEKEEELSLDLGDFGSEETQIIRETPLEPAKEEEGGLALDLGDLSLETPAGGGEPADETIDIESLALDMEGTEAGGEKEEIQLSLDELKVNETGELEIGKGIPSVAEEGKALEMEDFSLEQASPEKGPSEGLDLESEDFTLDLGEEEPSKSSDASGELSLDLENLDLELDLDSPEKTG